MNRGELRAYAKGKFALDESADDPRITDAQWNRYLNRGYRWLTAKARLFGSTWTSISTVAGTREYSIATLSPSIASVQAILFKQGGTSGSWRPLTPVPADQLTRAVDSWHDETGSPSHYYFRGLTLGLRPTPDTTNAGAFLEIWGWAMPQGMTSDGATDATGTPQIPEHLHDLIIPCACFEAAEQEAADGRGDAGLLLQMFGQRRQEALVELLQYVEGLDPSARFVDATHDLAGADYGW
jgi:hypothetical protein